MRILRLESASFRGLPDGTYAFGKERPAPLTVITGAGAAGKTTLLHAIVAAKEALGAQGLPPPSGSLLRRGRTSGRLLATWWLSDDEARAAEIDGNVLSREVDLGADADDDDPPEALAERWRAFDPDPATEKLELVPAGRRMAAGGKVPGDDAEARLRPSSAPHKYAGLVPWLVAVATRDAEAATAALRERGVLLPRDGPDSLAGVRSLLAELAPDLRLLGVARDDVPSLAFRRRSGETVGLADLSSREHDAVLLAGAVHRLGLARSLLLVDRPELFADDPSDAKRWTSALAGAVGQLVVTASPANAATIGAPVIRLG